MPMKIVTHSLTQKDFEPDGITEFVEVSGYTTSWWKRLKDRLYRKPKDVEIHKHSSTRKRSDI